MKHIPSSAGSFLALTASLAMLVGCPDPEAQQERMANQKLHEALAVLAEAESGWIATDAPISQTPEELKVLQLHRQEKLKEVRGQLEELVKNGNLSARIGAVQLLSDLYASEARHVTRQAMQDWTEVATSSGPLISYLVVVSKADSRADFFNYDESRTLGQFNQDLQTARTQQADIAQQISQLEAKVKELRDQRAKLDAQRAKAVAEAEKHNTKAFTAPGVTRYDLQVKGIEAQRVADQAAAQAEELGVRLQVFESELAVLQKQHELAGLAQTALTEEIERTQNRDLETQKIRQKALTDRDNSVASLQERFDSIAKRQQQLVQNGFEDGIQLSSKAVSELTQIIDQTGGAERQQVEADLLAKRLTKVFVLYQYLVATSSYGETLSEVSSQISALLGADRAKVYADAVERARLKQSDLLVDVKDELSKASELAGKLIQASPEGEQTRQMFEKQMQLIENYNSQVMNIAPL